MNAAPGSRAPLLRTAVAAVAIIDLLSFVYFLATTGGDATAARTFADIMSRTPVALAVAGVGGAAALAFARAPGRIAAAAITLVALALLSTAHAQLFGSPWRHLYYSGLCLAGWTAGLLVARNSRVPGDESYAATGALALLGAAYLNAGISKLVFGGGDWATSVPIQAAIIGQDGLVPGGILHSYRLLVVDTPIFAAALSVLTVVFELAGPLMLAGRRLRLLVAGGLLAMHFNILLLTAEILYWEAMLLLAVFAVATRDDADIAATAPARPFAGVWFVPVVAFLAAGAALGIRHQTMRFQELNKGETEIAAPQPPPTPPPQRIGPFVVGAALNDDWSIERLAIGERGLTVTLRGAPGRARFEITCATFEHDSPFDLGAAHIFYSNDVAFEVLEGAGRAIRETVRRAAGEEDVCAAIESWRAAAGS